MLAAGRRHIYKLDNSPVHSYAWCVWEKAVSCNSCLAMQWTTEDFCNLCFVILCVPCLLCVCYWPSLMMIPSSDFYHCLQCVFITAAIFFVIHLFTAVLVSSLRVEDSCIHLQYNRRKLMQWDTFVKLIYDVHIHISFTNVHMWCAYMMGIRLFEWHFSERNVWLCAHYMLWACVALF